MFLLIVESLESSDVMKEIKDIVAENIVLLRKQKKWTQAELAEKLNYSDKAISKWERGESSPDLESLHKLAEIFEVTVDFFFYEEDKDKKKYMSRTITTVRNDAVVLGLLSCAVLFIAVIILVGGYLKDPASIQTNWIAFVYCAPIWSLFTYFYFLKHKQYKLGRPICMSAFLWTLLATIYLQVLICYDNFWMIFLIGIPLQLAIIMFNLLKRN